MTCYFFWMVRHFSRIVSVLYFTATAPFVTLIPGGTMQRSQQNIAAFLQRACWIRQARA